MDCAPAALRAASHTLYSALPPRRAYPPTRPTLPYRADEATNLAYLLGEAGACHFDQAIDGKPLSPVRGLALSPTFTTS